MKLVMHTLLGMILGSAAGYGDAPDAMIPSPVVAQADTGLADLGDVRATVPRAATDLQTELRNLHDGLRELHAEHAAPVERAGRKGQQNARHERRDARADVVHGRHRM